MNIILVNIKENCIMMFTPYRMKWSPFKNSILVECVYKKHAAHTIRVLPILVDTQS